jgi:hypothetical protein
MKRKLLVNPRLKKQNILCSLAKVVLGTILCCGIPFVIVSVVKQDNARRSNEKIIENSNYAQFNNEYILAETNAMLEKFEKGEISRNEFLAKVDMIEDYSHTTYVKEADEISVEDKNKYNENIETIKDYASIQNASLVSMMVSSIALGTIQGLSDNKDRDYLNR